MKTGNPREATTVAAYFEQELGDKSMHPDANSHVTDTRVHIALEDAHQTTITCSIGRHCKDVIDHTAALLRQVRVAEGDNSESAQYLRIVCKRLILSIFR